MEASFTDACDGSFGITWKADDVMVINAADTRSDLTGWVTIDNKSGTTYGSAALKLVAGDVNRAEEPRRLPRALEVAAKAASMADAAATSSPRDSSSTTSTRSTGARRSRTTRPSSSR